MNSCADDLNPRGDIPLLHDVPDMGFNRVLTPAQSVTNLSRRESLVNQYQYFLLSFGQHSFFYVNEEVG